VAAAISILPSGKALKAGVTAKRAISLLGRRGNHVVYLLVKDGSPVYVGITDDLKATLIRHRGVGPLKRLAKDFDNYVVIASGLSENKAKAIETWMIERFAPRFTPGGLLGYNQRRSINPVNQPDLYAQAHRYASLWAKIVGLA
ncbi:MAG TPA: GIY-YIG nuclease family protein, partial [Streptosporangiaceae bacterium]